MTYVQLHSEYTDILLNIIMKYFEAFYVDIISVVCIVCGCTWVEFVWVSVLGMEMAAPDQLLSTPRVTHRWVLLGPAVKYSSCNTQVGFTRTSC